MKSEGYIQLHRELQDHWIFKNPEYLKAWIVILMEVNHTDKKVLIKGKPLDCKRGQSLNSIKTWSLLFGDWSKSRVRRFFATLNAEGKIYTEGDAKTTHLTVCNYSKYQTSRRTDDTSENDNPASVH